MPVCGNGVYGEESLRLWASVFEHTLEGICITDAQARIVAVNRAFSTITGYTAAEVLGRTPAVLKSGRQGPHFYAALWRDLQAQGYWQGELWNRRRSGESYAERLTINAVRDDSGRTTHYIAVFSDITAIKEAHRRLEDLAYYDPLTRLPNRVLLADRLRIALAQAARHYEMVAVCYLDLDGFKPVNDTHGHAAGDELLRGVATRLEQVVRAGDTVARLGGDEFVLLVTALRNSSVLERLLGRLLDELCRPFVLNSGEVAVSASVGVALYPHDGADPDLLLRCADQAMYVAKTAGRSCYRFFQADNGHGRFTAPPLKFAL